MRPASRACRSRKGGAARDVERDARLRVAEKAAHLEDVRSPGDPEGRGMVTELIDRHTVVNLRGFGRRIETRLRKVSESIGVPLSVSKT